MIDQGLSEPFHTRIETSQYLFAIVVNLKSSNLATSGNNVDTDIYMAPKTLVGKRTRVCFAPTNLAVWALKPAIEPCEAASYLILARVQLDYASHI